MFKNHWMKKNIFHNKIEFRWRGVLNLSEPKIYEDDTIDKHKSINGSDRHDYVAILWLPYSKL